MGHPGTASVVCVGTATLDTIALVGRMPGADERIVAEEIRTAGGGPAATAAVALAGWVCRWSSPVWSVTTRKAAAFWTTWPPKGLTCGWSSGGVAPPARGA